MPHANGDIRVLRDLANEYADLVHKDVQDERRRIWSSLNSLERTRPTVLASFGMWNVWCREVFGDDRMQCEDPFYRAHERSLRMAIFQEGVGDDCIAEPWITQRAAVAGGWGGLWGVKQGHSPVTQEGGSWKFDPPIKDWADVARLKPVPHSIDEEATARDVARLQDAVGDILPVNIDRGPAYQGFQADISTNLVGLRGLEQVMMDIYEHPKELHALLGFMRDGILAAQDAAEAAGDWSLTTQANQAMAYCKELEQPRANSGPRLRKDLWCHCAAQEFTLISPAMHDEFMLQYQLPIIEPVRPGLLRLLRGPDAQDRHAAPGAEPAHDRRDAARRRGALRRADRHGLRHLLAPEPGGHDLLPLRRGPDPPHRAPRHGGVQGPARDHPPEGHRDCAGRARPAAEVGGDRPQRVGRLRVRAPSSPSWLSLRRARLRPCRRRTAWPSRRTAPPSCPAGA